jgi:hypothetical protein
MTQPANEQTVLGDFNDVELEFEGRKYRLFRRGGRYWAEFDDPDARPARGGGPPERITRPMVQLTGSHSMQIYWYPSGDTRKLGQLPVHYLLQEKRWVPSYATLLQPRRHNAESDTGRWNDRCVQCHATHGRPRPLQSGGYDTLVAEMGISCEACHGPGEKHAAARRKALEAPDELAVLDDPIVHPGKLDHRLSSQVCGLCHSFTLARSQEIEEYEILHGFMYRPGDELEKTFLLLGRNEATRRYLFEQSQPVDEFLDERFWPDGEARSAGREYNGLVDSACHSRGQLSCLSCHAMHKAHDDPRSDAEWANQQLAPGMRGNAACTQCHDQPGYASPEHTHHAENSSGALCYNCHMPHTTYSLMRAMRSHRIASPSVAVSLETGRPNACNLCHLDKSLGWTANWLAQWYEQPIPKLSEDDKSVAASVQWALTGDAAQRAIIGWNMGWEEARMVSGTDWQPPILGQLLDDPYDTVRFVGHVALRGIPGYADLPYDYVASRAQRLKAVKQLRDTWNGRAASRKENLAVLIDNQGRLSESIFSRLVKRRNNRPFSMLE